MEKQLRKKTSRCIFQWHGENIICVVIRRFNKNILQPDNSGAEYPLVTNN